MTRLTLAQIRQAKRDRRCATCHAALSGSDVGTMGQALCIWCRVDLRRAEREAAVAETPLVEQGEETADA